MSPVGSSLLSMVDARFRNHGLGPVLDSLTLAPSQKKIADLPLGKNCLIYGVPGSGKTTALKALVLNRLRGPLKPEQILVLAQTRESATTLRDELALEYQGSTPGPLARTLASFAFGVLRERAISQGINPPELITGSEQDQIISELIQEFLKNDLPADWPKHLRRQVLELRGFRTELRDLITVCLEHEISATELAELGVNNKSPEWVAMARFFAGYLKRLRDPANENRHDPSTLLTVVINQLRENVAPKLVTDLKLIVVDDAQELTPAASLLLKTLASKGADLVLFGDPDATTMGFRSANPMAMKELVEGLDGEYLTVNLLEEIGSRHPDITAVLAKTASRISTERAGTQRSALGATDRAVGNRVQGRVFDLETSELAWLARKLRKLHIKNGIAWSEMAVIARSRTVLEKWAAALASESVPTQIHGSQTSFKGEFATGNLLRLAKFCLEPEELSRDVILELLRNPYSGLDSLAIRRIRRRLRQLELDAGGERTSDQLLIELFEKPEVAKEIYGDEGKRVRLFLKVLTSARELSQKEGATSEEILWTIWSSSPMVARWQELANGIGEVALQAGRNLDSLVALFAAANQFAERHPESGPVEFINEQLERDVPQDTLALVSRDDEKVLLATSSSLIGRRFKVIALPGLTEGVWPNLKPRSSLLGAIHLDSVLNGKQVEETRTELIDELRLLYKAVGAASERLIVTAVDGDETQLSQFVRLILGQIPKTKTFAKPRYTLRGMVGNLRRTLVTAEGEKERLEAAYGLARLALEGQPGADPKQWAGIIKFDSPEALVPLTDDETGKVWIYPSQLDAFIRCPLHWFMQAHGGSDKNFEANFGTLLHKVLEEAKSTDYAQLWKAVESKWHTLEFEADWLEKKELRRAQKMVRNLSIYLEGQKAAGYTLIGSEVGIDFELGRARIKGRVDRIEQGPEGQIVIVDLKTGSSEPSADNNAQLGLYQIAYMENGFEQMPEDAGTLEGASLVWVADEKSKVKPQPSLQLDSALNEHFRALLDSSIDGMAAADAKFEANIGTHCYDSHSFGKCKILLTPAVSYVE
jgi:superfamily I DNA/RNA helicase/RecB family exonuclease